MPLMVARSRNFIASSFRAYRSEYRSMATRYRWQASSAYRDPAQTYQPHFALVQAQSARSKTSTRLVRAVRASYSSFRISDIHLSRFFLRLPPHRHSKPSSAINGTEITTVAPRVPLKTRDHRTVPATKYVSLTIFFVRGYVILYSLKDASFVPLARR